jgi:hypothetical protein
MVEPAADRHSLVGDGGGRAEGMTEAEIAEVLAADTPVTLRTLIDARLQAIIDARLAEAMAALEADPEYQAETDRILYGTGDAPNIVGVLYVKRKRTRAKHERRHR